MVQATNDVIAATPPPARIERERPGEGLRSPQNPTSLLRNQPEPRLFLRPAAYLAEHAQFWPSRAWASFPDAAYSKEQKY
jgi:hypothetical protein